MPVMSAINFGDKLASDKPVRSAAVRKSKPVSVAFMTTKRQSWVERYCATGNAISVQSRADKSHIWQTQNIDKKDTGIRWFIIASNRLLTSCILYVAAKWW